MGEGLGNLRALVEGVTFPKPLQEVFAIAGSGFEIKHEGLLASTLWLCPEEHARWSW